MTLQVTVKTGPAIASILFSRMESLLSAVDWLVAGLTKQPAAGLDFLCMPLSV